MVLDHFGSKYIQSKHLSQLIIEKKMIFWTRQKISKLNHNFINHINLNIGFTKKSDIRKNALLLNKKFMPGDTDSFITIN